MKLILLRIVQPFNIRGIQKKRCSFFLLQFFFILLVSLSLDAQPKIKGVVRLQNSKVNTGKTQYISLAQIEADFAGVTKSGSDGKFTLKFAKDHSERPIKIKIYKSGLEVVNADALSTFIPAGDDTAELPFYMCPKGQLASAILKFRGVAEDQITKKFKAKIRILERENRASSTARLELEEEKDKAISQLKKNARFLAVINLDDELPIYQEAYELFKQGEVEEAQSLLEAADLSKKIDELKEAKKYVQKLDEKVDLELNSTANALVLDANMALTNLEFDKSLFAYSEAVRALDSTNVAHNLEYAELLAVQSKFGPAIRLYEKTLRLAKNDLALQAYIHYSLGSVYLVNSMYKENCGSFTAAHDIYLELMQKGGADDFKPLAAIVEVLLGISYLVKGDNQEALIWMRKGITSFDELKEKNSTKFTPYAEYARVVGNLSLSVAEQEENIEQLRKLAKSDPDTYNPLLAMANVAWIGKYSTSQSGRSDQTQNELYNAKVNKALEESIALLKHEIVNLKASSTMSMSAISSLTELQPLPDLLSSGDRKAMLLFPAINSLPNLTLIYSFHDLELLKRNYQNAKVVFDTAFQRCESFLKLNNDRYLPQYLEFSATKAGLYIIEEDFDQAIEFLENGYQKTLLLAEESPGTYDLLLALNRLLFFQAHHAFYYETGTFKQGYNREKLLAILSENEGAFQELKSNFIISKVIESIEVDRLSLQREHYPEYYLFRSAQLLEGNLKLTLERLDFNSYFSGARVKNKLLERLTTYYFKEEDGIKLLGSYQDFVNFYTEKENQDSVLHYLGKQIEIYEKVFLASENPEIKKEMPLNAGEVSWYMLGFRKFEEAEKYARIGIRNAPHQFSIYTNLAPALLAQGKVAQAMRYYAAHTNETYITPSYEGTCKEIFLSDLDSLIAAGISLPEVEQIRGVIENPEERTPKELKRGLLLMAKAKDAKATGQTIQALQFYEDLLNLPSFNKYFSGDFVFVWKEITRLSKGLNREVNPVPESIETESLRSAAQTINNRCFRLHRFSNTVNYQLILAQMKTAVQLLEVAAKRESGGLLATIEKDKKNYSVNLAFYQVFNEEPNKALAIFESMHNASPNNSLLTAKYVFALLMSNEYDKAVTVLANSSLSNHKEYDSLPTFLSRLKYDLHFLKRRGVLIKQVERSEGWIRRNLKEQPE